jgi:hypothetical protein
MGGAGTVRAAGWFSIVLIAAAGCTGPGVTTGPVVAARRAVQVHDAPAAIAAIDRAQAEVAVRAGPPSENHAWPGLPATRALGEARQAVTRQQWQLADQVLEQAAWAAGVWVE